MRIEQTREQRERDEKKRKDMYNATMSTSWPAIRQLRGGKRKLDVPHRETMRFRAKALRDNGLGKHRIADRMGVSHRVVRGLLAA